MTNENNQVCQIIFRDICSSDTNIQSIITPLFKILADAYVKVYDEQKSALAKYNKEEFFGLRDFYRYYIISNVHT